MAHADQPAARPSAAPGATAHHRLPPGGGLPHRRLALVAITTHGADIVRHLAASYRHDPDAPAVDVFYMKKHARGDEEGKGFRLFEGSVRRLLPDLFSRYDGLVLVISLGAVVRMIAPLLADKKTDPAVVVIDDRAEHVVSVLSGHLGGANVLTRDIARRLGARPVITTASDVQGTIAVDLFGRRFGWRLVNWDKVTPVSAAVVNGERIAVVQESGEPDWWEHPHPLPPNIAVYRSVREALAAGADAYLVVTHRLLDPDEEAVLENGVLYRPRSIVLGFGCNRGTSAAEIEGVIYDTLAELRFSVDSVRNVATIDRKKDEPGLMTVCAKYGWPLETYTPAELNAVPIAHPSATVYRYTGAYGVSEPAAKRSANTETLVLEKKRCGNCTISVALVDYGPPRWGAPARGAARMGESAGKEGPR
ncbi:cobalamin biosynthesis protein [Calditerricola yamamurae]